METLGHRLRRLRKNKGWTLVQAAAHLGLKGHSTYSNWEYNRTQPDAEMLAKISEVFGVTTDYLLTGNNETISQYIKLQESKNKSKEIISDYLNNKQNDNNQFIQVPIYGEIKAGYGLLAEQNIIGYDIVARDQVIDGEYFYLVVKGDSMIEEGIKEGSRVLVRRQDYVDNGKIGVVLINGDEATLKRVFYEGENVVLQSSNRNIPPRILPASDVRIQGQVKSYTVDV